MSWEAAAHLNDLHLEFLLQFLKAAQLDASPASALPTVIFLVCTFLLLHHALHRRSGPLTPKKLLLYREVGFQWSFFYITRMWFLYLKAVQQTSKWFEDYLKEEHSEQRLLWLEHSSVRTGLYTVVTLIALVPFTIVLLGLLWKRNIPNFLLWVGEDPWVHSEIGISGHYLERPPTFVLSKKHGHAYRLRKSTSVDHISKPTRKQPFRGCKSLIAFRSSSF